MLEMTLKRRLSDPAQPNLTEGAANRPTGRGLRSDPEPNSIGRAAVFWYYHHTFRDQDSGVESDWGELGFSVREDCLDSSDAPPLFPSKLQACALWSQRFASQ